MPTPTNTDERDTALRQALQRWFGFDALRPLQREAIDAALDGRDALVVLPTGGGKSLCYQLPALVLDRLVVVVSPLIALMQDQVDGLRLLGVPAAAVHGNLDPAARAELQAMSRQGALRLLFAAPERLFQPQFLGWLQQQDVAAFAIDEAHCISQWGHDFRPEYRRLAELREHFPGVPFQAFTATATPRVRDDIARQLQLRDPVVLVGTFDRPELFYRVLPRHDLDEQVAAAIGRHPDAAAIVYCIARKETEDLAEALQRRGIAARAYHAGLGAGERTQISADFRAERLHVIVATVAFGMGIDRADVRLVVHAGMPKSIEAYQQETGRAGRDGEPAECLLLYSASDAAKWRSLLERRSAEAAGDPATLDAQLQLLQQMQRFAGRARCRHRALSEYFGQTHAQLNCGACDICLDELELVPDGHVLAQKILSAVVRTGQRFGAAYVIDVLRGSRSEKVLQRGHDRIPTWGVCKEVPVGRLGNFIDQLVDQELLLRSDGEYPTLQLGPLAMEVLRGKLTAELRLPKRMLAAGARRSRDERARSGAEANEPELTAAEQGLFEALRGLRRQLALELSVPSYVVCSDATLRALSRQRPRDNAELLAVRGIGNKKADAFGARLLQAIADHLREHGAAFAADPAAPEAETQRGVPEPATKSTLRFGKAAAIALFRDGAPIEQVVAATGRAPSTVWGYLADWIRNEPPADLRRWVDADTEAQVTAALMPSEDGRLKPVFEALGGTVPYETIRIVAAWLAGRADAGA